MKKDTKLRVIRINPDARAIASISIDAPKNQEAVLRNVKRVLRAETVGHRELLPEQGDSPALMIAGGLAVDERMRGFRLRGCEDHAGIGILFGKGPGGGMVDSPVDVTWVSRRIVWLDGEDPAALRQRAEETVAILPDEIRATLLATVDRGPFAAGDSLMWLDGEVSEEIVGAMQKLGLVDEPSKGQRLSRFGDQVLGVLKEAR